MTKKCRNTRPLAGYPSLSHCCFQALWTGSRLFFFFCIWSICIHVSREADVGLSKQAAEPAGEDVILTKKAVFHTPVMTGLSLMVVPLGRKVVLMKEIHKKHSSEQIYSPVTAVLIWPLADPEKCSQSLVCCTDRRLLHCIQSNVINKQDFSCFEPFMSKGNIVVVMNKDPSHPWLMQELQLHRLQVNRSRRGMLGERKGRKDQEQWRCLWSVKRMQHCCRYAHILVVEQTYQAPISFLNCPSTALKCI